MNRQPKKWQSPRRQPGSTRGTAFLPSALTTVMKYVRRWDGILGGRRIGFQKHLAPMVVKTMYEKNKGSGDNKANDCPSLLATRFLLSSVE